MATESSATPRMRSLTRQSPNSSTITAEMATDSSGLGRTLINAVATAHYHARTEQVYRLVLLLGRGLLPIVTSCVKAALASGSVLGEKHFVGAA